MCLDDAMANLEKKQERERFDLIECITARGRLPDLTGTAAEGMEPRIMVLRSYGAKLLITFGGSHHTEKQFTPMEALRIIERFELASVAAAKTRLGTSIIPSYRPIDEEKGEEYIQGSAYFPAYINADSFGATMEAWAALRDADKNVNGESTKIHIRINLKDSYKYAEYRPASQSSNRRWGSINDSDDNIRHWAARAPMKATQIREWWGVNGKNSFTYLWLDAHEAMAALGCEIESYCANYIQE